MKKGTAIESSIVIIDCDICDAELEECDFCKEEFNDRDVIYCDNGKYHYHGSCKPKRRKEQKNEI